MKKAAGIFSVIILIAILSINAAALVKLNSYVNDYANIIDTQQESEINNLIIQTEKNTSAEIVIVTIESLEGETIENYAVKLFEENQIGKKDKDNGILILIAIKEREYRVEVGYGLEGAVPDAYKVRIGTRILEPYFKQGKYGEGLYLATKEISAIIHGESPGIIAKSTKEIVQKEIIPIIIIIITIIFILGFAFASAKQHGYPMFFPPIGGFGRGSGGFGSGGFGGFGGGSSGGGGFGGKW